MKRAVPVLAIAVALLVACTRASSPSASSDAAAMACANLALRGCSIAANIPRCEAALTAAPTEHHTTEVAIACAATASSAPAVVACDPKYFTCP